MRRTSAQGASHEPRRAHHSRLRAVFFWERRMNDLLTLADIAAMHRCSEKHARDVLVRLPGFPREAPTSTPRKRLWLRSEVRAYIHRKPAQIPHMILKAA